jgi:hypothetical protein
LGRDVDARRYTCLEARAGRHLTIEGVVFEDHDVPYKERILQLGIVGVAELYAARCEEALLELGVQYITGRRASSTVYCGIGVTRNPTKPWREVRGPGHRALRRFGDVNGADIGSRKTASHSVRQ